MLGSWLFLSSWTSSGSSSLPMKSGGCSSSSALIVGSHDTIATGNPSIWFDIQSNSADCELHHYVLTSIRCLPNFSVKLTN